MGQSLGVDHVQFRFAQRGADGNLGLQVPIKSFHELTRRLIVHIPEAHQDGCGPGGQESLGQSQEALPADEAPQSRPAGRQGREIGIQLQLGDLAHLQKPILAGILIQGQNNGSGAVVPGTLADNR